MDNATRLMWWGKARVDGCQDNKLVVFCVRNINLARRRVIIHWPIDPPTHQRNNVMRAQINGDNAILSCGDIDRCSWWNGDVMRATWNAQCANRVTVEVVENTERVGRNPELVRVSATGSDQCCRQTVDWTI